MNRPAFVRLLMISRNIAVMLAVALTPAWVANAADLPGLASSAAADLRKSLAELSSVRQEIETERVGLAREGSELERKLIEARAEFAKAQRFQENQLVELNAVKAEAKRQSDQAKYIESLLAEYTRSFRSRLSFAEEPRYEGVLDEADRAAVAPDLTPAARSGHALEVLTTALKRNEAALGGELFAGKALNKQGLVRDGKVAVIGPVAMFSTASGDLTGLLQQELNKADPTIMPVERSLDESIRALVTSGSGQIALDATLGNAFKLAALEESLYEKIAKGGFMMVPLLLMGAVALAVALWKWWQLSRVRLSGEEDLQAVLRHLENQENDKALARARGIPGLAGDLLTTAVEHAEEKKEYIEEVLYEKMLGARTQLERGIAFLALSATTGPLMGLLGTVMGMIATFKMISSFGSGDPKLLAAGISEALICTATGMAVAIPALLFHAFLSRKAKGIIGSMEKTAVGFVNAAGQPEKSIFS